MQTHIWYRIVQILRESLFVLPMQRAGLHYTEYFRGGSLTNLFRTCTETVIAIARVSECNPDELCLSSYLLSIGVNMRCLHQCFLLLFCKIMNVEYLLYMLNYILKTPSGMSKPVHPNYRACRILHNDQGAWR